MANKMLIDATHPEETRVVVVRGNRVEEFDYESANRKQLRGNIYLAKVTRVEPSLQAAFVDYGGNRHGFLAFSEIHPDYYQIPVADRQALIAEEERAHRDAEAEADRRAGGGGRRRERHQQRAAERVSETIQSEPTEGDLNEAAEADLNEPAAGETNTEFGDTAEHAPAEGEALAATAEGEPAGEPVAAEITEIDTPSMADATASAEPVAAEEIPQHDHPEAAGDAEVEEHDREEARETPHESGGEGEEEEIVESVGGADVMEEVPDRMPRLRRQYKIQEVIKRRQIMLVQVVKEERGTKGAALTTYLSLAGRYSVLMPNTARGGGISRKITNFQDRKRLKEVAQELEVPEGMGVILRTAGAARTKTEIKRDFEYLLRMWETVRDLTLKSTAPTLVYEEGSLVKRSIRDLYNKDIDEVIVAGDGASREARDFMRMLMPSHAKNVKPYRESQPILTRYGIESQLDAMFSPVVQLRSGGYIVINQAEALVAIDVNSGRATREHHIEDTALKTNMEAAEEIARQLRLRDLAGLIVIDFIDMDEKRNNRSVERRLKECLKHDRARIQVGRISHFGLLEMSRQRIRTSVLESSTDKCPHCGGTGHVRSVASVALQVLRMIEETLLRGGTHNLVVRTRSDIAIYVLNHKRAHLRELEERFRLAITISADAAIGGQTPFMIERGEQVHSLDQARAIAAAQPQPAAVVEPEEEFEPIVEGEEAEAEVEAIADDEADAAAEGEEFAEEGPSEGDRHDEGHAMGEAGDGARRRRRRRRRGRRGEGRDGRDTGPFTHEAPPEHAAAPDEFEGGEEDEADGHGEAERGPGEPRERQAQGEGDRRRRRRGRRGGRRNRRDREGGERFAPDHAPERVSHGEHDAIEPELAEAVSDFGGPPLDREPAAPSEPDLMQAAPPPEPVAPSEAAPEPARRRSTVRERAPLVSDEGATPYAAPSAPEQHPSPPAADPSASHEEPHEDAAKPRRTGWWSKRILGG
ncbi:MAG TPA: Rne/Rng family ribonuclease [Xanthobacteraceae bacterium]|nr:Rne/Rng family ribonuclease [Xanthobacteraceae bacterium]